MILAAAIYSVTQREPSRPDGDLTPENLAGRASIGLVCDPDDYVDPARHERGSQPSSIDAGWHRRLCSAAQVLPDGDVPGVPAQPFGYDVFPAPLDTFPALVDSNSPAYWRGDTLNLLNSAWAETYRSQGGGALAVLNPTLVTLPSPPRPGNVWIEAVWQDPESLLLYGWYHFEPKDQECEDLTAPIIGAAISRDGGATWEDQGFVLENGYPNDCNFTNGFFTGGNGDFSVILGPEGRNLYFLFSNYQGPLEEQGIAIARSSIDDKGQPGTVWKYYQGRWDEPGLGGKVTALFRTPTGWLGPSVDAPWGPSVHWNTYLNSYVMLFNQALGELWAQGGIHMSFSKDLINWTRPVRIIETNEFYPQILGLGPDGTDTLGGQTVRVYVGGISEHLIEFNLAASQPQSRVVRLVVPEGVRPSGPAPSVRGDPAHEPGGEDSRIAAVAEGEPPEGVADDTASAPASPQEEGAPLPLGEGADDVEAGALDGVPDL